MYYGSIEAGGTKFVLAVADEQFELVDKIRISTTTPEETIAATVDYFKSKNVAAIGLGSFGPIDINSKSKTYGFITSTPKAGWANTDLVGLLEDALHVPIAFTTDVNASAYGEMMNTALENLVYFTIGTGIGGGAIQGGHFIGATSHAEMGHQMVKRHPNDLYFKGICPFHGDCLEGLASGPSLEARTGISGEELPADSPEWEILAYYIAQGVLNATLTLAPDAIILGGGIMEQPNMLAHIQKEFVKLLNHYVVLPCPIDEYLRLPSVSENGSATLGNFALGKAALELVG